MQGQNAINARNKNQYDLVKEVERALQEKKNNPDSFKGLCFMLDGPGGNGKSFCLETIYYYCNIPQNQYLCLCSAASGKFD